MILALLVMMPVLSLFDHPLTLSLAGSLGGFILGYLALRRGAKVDKAAVQSEEDKGRIASIDQIIKGLGGLTGSLQEDNRILREGLNRVVVERDELLEEVKRLAAIEGEGQ